MKGMEQLVTERESALSDQKEKTESVINKQVNIMKKVIMDDFRAGAKETVFPISHFHPLYQKDWSLRKTICSRFKDMGNDNEKYFTCTYSDLRRSMDWPNDVEEYVKITYKD